MPAMTLLDIAKKAYRGECVDKWEGLEGKITFFSG